VSGGGCKAAWAVCGALLLGTVSRLPASEAAQPSLPDFLKLVSRGQVPAAELSRTIQGQLGSGDRVLQRQAVEVASVAGKQLAGTAAVDDLCRFVQAAGDVDLKYATVRAISRIGDPRTRPFFSALLRSREPVSSRIVAVGYLMGDLDLRRDDCDAAVSTLLEGLGTSAAAEQRARPLESEQAWGKLMDLIGRYRLPALAAADQSSEARAKAATAWWQRERAAVVGKFPVGPKLLRIGAPPHAVYDWDPGIARINELLGSSDEMKCKEGIGMALEAGKQLVGTSVVGQLQAAASKWAETGGNSTGLEVQRKVLLALAAIDDPASRPWFAGQLDGSRDVGMRVLAARHLSAALRESEVDAVGQVLSDVAALDDHPVYQGRNLAALRRAADETVANTAKVKKIPVVSVDWSQDSSARVQCIRDWWAAHQLATPTESK